MVDLIDKKKGLAPTQIWGRNIESTLRNHVWKKKLILYVGGCKLKVMSNPPNKTWYIALKK
jgi:hypothetical protein